MEKKEKNLSEKDRLSRKQNILQIVKFTLFSISAGIVQAGCFALLNEVVHFPYWPAYLFALVSSILYNFTINRRFTFKSATNVPIAMLKVAAYYAVFTPFSTWWGDALTGIGWNEYLVLGGTMLINLITEYLFSRFVVYRHSINTNKQAKKEKDQDAKQNPLEHL